MMAYGLWPRALDSCSPNLSILSNALMATDIILVSITVSNSHRGAMQFCDTKYLKEKSEQQRLHDKLENSGCDEKN